VPERANRDEEDRALFSIEAEQAYLAACLIDNSAFARRSHAITRAHRKDGFIRLVQGKTEEELWIPEHRDLTAQLTTVEQMSLLTTSQGKAFDAVYFGAWFADVVEKAGLPDDCVLHGRKETCRGRRN